LSKTTSFGRSKAFNPLKLKHSSSISSSITPLVGNEYSNKDAVKSEQYRVFDSLVIKNHNLGSSMLASGGLQPTGNIIPLKEISESIQDSHNTICEMNVEQLDESRSKRDGEL